MIVWRHVAAMLIGLLAIAWAFVAHAPTSAVCSAPFGACPVIAIAGEETADDPAFLGLNTPAVIADPMRPERIWLAYTRLVTRSPIGLSGWGATCRTRRLALPAAMTAARHGALIPNFGAYPSPSNAISKR